MWYAQAGSHCLTASPGHLYMAATTAPHHALRGAPCQAGTWNKTVTIPQAARSDKGMLLQDKIYPRFLFYAKALLIFPLLLILRDNSPGDSIPATYGAGSLPRFQAHPWPPLQ